LEKAIYDFFYYINILWAGQKMPDTEQNVTKPSLWPYWAKKH